MLADLLPVAASRDRALSAIAVAQLIGLPAGALLGGLLVSRFGWRFSFLLNVGMAFATIPAALGLLPKSQPIRREGNAPLNVVGLCLIAGISALLIWTVSLIGDGGLWRVEVGGYVLLTMVLFGAFVMGERRSVQPIIPVSLIRLPSFVRACALVALITCLNTGIIFTLSLYLQRVGAARSAMTWDVFVPMAIGSFLGTWLIPPLVARTSRSAIILTGLVIDAAVIICVALGVPGSFRFLPAIMAIVSICMLLIFVPAQTQAFAQIPVADRGVAASLIRISYNLPTGVGIAIVAASLGAGGERLALLSAAAFSVLGIFMFALTRTRTVSGALA
jgi:predicted MFS family arabinose efflux permease